MALSTYIQHQSLAILQSQYTDLSENQQKTLADINEIFASRDYPLNTQSNNFLDKLHRSLTNKERHSEHDVAKICASLHEQLDKETDDNRKTHARQGTFSAKLLHQRHLRTQMQDDDLHRVMPKSTATIEIFAPVNRFDNSWQSTQTGMKQALADENVKHLVIPVGPGHWRGIFLTKPDNSEDKLKLEIFDPYGAANAKALTGFAKQLITGCDVAQQNLSISHYGPEHQQKDGYACGDFTCAESHRKLKSWGVQEGLNQTLIDTLENHGNKDNMLRHASRDTTQKLSRPDTAVAPDGPQNQKEQEQALTAELRDLEAKMNSSEKKIYQSAVNNDSTKATTVFKREIAWLIKNRDTLFNKADKAAHKEAQSAPLSDEELAAKLQAEEIKKSGLS